MSDAYLWPAAECTHPPEYWVAGHSDYDGAGRLVHRVPDHCSACGYSLAPPRDDERRR